ncbi:MAG: glycosyltransferase family 39 protein [Phycisphaeraceae bacterium]
MTLRSEPIPPSTIDASTSFSPWLSWKGCLAVILLTALARIIFIIWLNPFELSGDEAQYWDWSRRLDWSYYSKGPGVAWTIAPFTALFGHHDWAVRLPAVLWAAVATLAMARLTMDVAAARGGTQRQIERAGFFGALAFTFFVGYQFSSVAMTIDGPHMAWWIIACWAAFRAFHAWHKGRTGTSAWLALGAAIGIGMLFKYTIAVLIVGIIAFMIVGRRSIRFRLGPALGALGVLLLCMSPVVIWNAQHDWITVKHLIGRMNLPGGDEVITNKNAAGFGFKWALRMLGDQLAILNITVIVFILAVRRRSAATANSGPPSSSGRFPAFTLMVCLALPILLMYLGISFISKIQANWPLPGYATLLVLVAVVVSETTDRRAGLVRWWRAWVTLGLAIFLGSLALAPIIRSAPVTALREANEGIDRAIERLTENSEAAARLQPVIEDLRRRTGKEPMVIAGHYMLTAQMAFYLPGQPVAYSGAAYLGSRESSYDYFEDTRLDNPALLGRPAVLYGGNLALWESKLEFERIDMNSQTHAIYAAVNYRGPRPRSGPAKENGQ